MVSVKEILAGPARFALGEICRTVPVTAEEAAIGPLQALQIAYHFVYENGFPELVSHDGHLGLAGRTYPPGARDSRNGAFGVLGIHNGLEAKPCQIWPLQVNKGLQYVPVEVG